MAHTGKASFTMNHGYEGIDVMIEIKRKITDKAEIYLINHVSISIKSFLMRMEGIMSDVSTILGSLPLCSLFATKSQGKKMHVFIIMPRFESHVPVGNALIEMYSKAESLNNAILAFEDLRIKDVLTWTTNDLCIWNVWRMKEDSQIFSADKEDSHSGLVQDGRACFNRMREEYNIEPRIELYGCMVDLLSRSGMLAKAEDFILSMSVQPDASMWGALLSTCRVSGDTEVAELVVELLVELKSTMKIRTSVLVQRQSTFTIGSRSMVILFCIPLQENFGRRAGSWSKVPSNKKNLNPKKRLLLDEILWFLPSCQRHGSLLMIFGKKIVSRVLPGGRDFPTGSKSQVNGGTSFRELRLTYLIEPLS
ncbi:hypothetical protein RND71_019461 [Anisodus tanguticus]|uniref:Pentatricopeptide repeat-containing protein n=1 Tax=Anisodus tanguticus TaxID=243964 RepID=A0AAE1RXG0_9SOLA|nr:hypothetical protein RND71_019461 [Anisodus tanguticus]